ncbi:CubicO group peptidase (beta-lactamase class C family) [Salsuginibacillus halophilus]|uniref:CubicO group peptidase (Beta-lactamase class C family) n=1 Tax=Salsuginibacillus halophilus TaxID=517424 RepID=A0A2P8H9S0_9BACI|nr:serine hydrolase domain-containing protein [Salsuginibacillus halophilus]PSL42930.1 CubicO group peptidase (beta-lactamase class C family) [Salsuginibacillus halophilus]
MTNEAFEAYAEQLMHEHHVPGAFIGVERLQSSAYAEGFGFRNVAKAKPVTAHTVFGLASITKSFTCLAVLQLQEAGKLNVHDPVKRYLPEFYTKASDMSGVTIHHLMTHTSGLPPLDSHLAAKKRSFEQDPSIEDFPGVQMEITDQDPIDTYKELMAYIASLDIELLGVPGEAFSYSNDGYGLLGAIITRVSGQPYELYMKEHVLEPLGMHDSSFFIEDSFEDTMPYAKRGTGYDAQVYAAPVWWDAPPMRATGGLKASGADMLRYVNLFLNGGIVDGTRLLSEENIELMMTPHVEMEPGRWYGYGFMIRPDYYGAKLVEHGGSLKAISSLLALIPERGLGGVTLTNLAGVPASALLHGALNAEEGRAPEESHVVYPAGDEATAPLTDYEGEFASLEGMRLKAHLEEGELQLTYQNETFTAETAGVDGFLIEVRGETEYVRFVRDVNGDVSHVAFHYRQFPKKA